jgi:flagellar hook-basal body complex protein FliE
MTAPIAPISAVMPLTTVPGVASVSGTAGSGDDFAAMLAGGLEKLQAMQARTDDLAVKAATGDLSDVHDYMIASTESGLATQMTVAVRNKAVEAFTEIMRMQA